MSERPSLHIDVFADVICPWCWIGERRLRRVLAERNDLEVTANWRPFQLNPHAPLDGESWQTVIDEKFGGLEEAQAIWNYVQEAGAEESLDFRFDLITRFPNSRRAHELVLFAATQGRTWATVDALCAANFREGLDVGDPDTLLDIGEAVGLPRIDIARILAAEHYASTVVESQREAARIGITGVPLFILNGQYGISGAQPEAVFRRAIAHALNERVNEPTTESTNEQTNEPTTASMNEASPESQPVE